MRTAAADSNTVDTAANVGTRVPFTNDVRGLGPLPAVARYLDSGLGKVMLAFFSDARSVMQRSGQIYAMVTKGPRIESEARGDEILIRYRDYHGPLECYPVGTLEGACRHFGARCEIQIEVLSPSSADYRVRIL